MDTSSDIVGLYLYADYSRSKPRIRYRLYHFLLFNIRICVLLYRCIYRGMYRFVVCAFRCFLFEQKAQNRGESNLYSAIDYYRDCCYCLFNTLYIRKSYRCYLRIPLAKFKTNEIQFYTNPFVLSACNLNPKEKITTETTVLKYTNEEFK